MSRMNIAMDAFDGATDIRRTAQRQTLSGLWRTVTAPAKGMMAA